MTLSAPDITARGLVVTRLQVTDMARVTELCRGCKAFFELVIGEPDASKISVDLLEHGPPGVDATHKPVFGIERDDHLVGVVDLIEGFPGDGEWYVGLLLLLPEERARGTGRALWTAIETSVRAHHGHVVRLIVQEQNPRAARFWTSLGFIADGEVPQHLGGRTNLCWRYRKQLAMDATALTR